MNFIYDPWPWYVAGPLIGLTVPALFLIGNKTFGISSSLRHICAACVPFDISYFKYDWRKEVWNLFFVAGIALGGFLTVWLMPNDSIVLVHPHLAADLYQSGLTDYSGLVPVELFNWNSLFSLRGFLLMVVGGFFVGFGTRYAGGCTSGHAISGISNLQLPSLIATCCFMAGGFFMANVVLPYILNL
jgi:uncharacterized membrane protein YedE/YeeE